MAQSPSRNMIITVVLFLASAVIFTIDLLIPLGLIIWLAYIPLIFLALFLKNGNLLKLLGYSACILITIAFIFDISGTKGLVSWPLSLYHRAFGILIISIITYISLKLLETKTRLDRMEKLIKVCAWTKKINIGDEWLTIEEFMRRYLHKDVTHGISPEAFNKMFEGSHVSDDGEHKQA